MCLATFSCRWIWVFLTIPACLDTDSVLILCDLTAFPLLICCWVFFGLSFVSNSLFMCTGLPQPLIYFLNLLMDNSWTQRNWYDWGEKKKISKTPMIPLPFMAVSPLDSQRGQSLSSWSPGLPFNYLFCFFSESDPQNFVPWNMEIKQSTTWTSHVKPLKLIIRKN